MPKKTPIISKNPEEALKVLCLRLVSAIETLAPNREFITIGLSGGSFIQQLSTELPNHKDKLEPHISKLRFLFCDERYVAANDKDSTFFMFSDTHKFFEKLNVPLSHVYPVNAEAPTVQACADDYESKLRPLLNSNCGFDILLLGMGPDGHTCSLFPDHASFDEGLKTDRLVIPCLESPKPPPYRVTLTFKYINRSSYLFFNAFGEGKAEVLKKIFVDDDKKIPSANVEPELPDGVLLWFIDQPAAALL